MRFLNFLSLCAIMLMLIVTSPSSGILSVEATAAAIGLLVAAMAVAAVLLHLYDRGLPVVCTQTAHGPAPDERRLRGSFRRNHRPDTPGRPRPRAPGSSAGTL